MSKIEVLGPKNLLVQVLETIQRSELMEIDGEIQHRLETGAERHLLPIATTDRAHDEVAFYSDLDKRVSRLLALLPCTECRTTYLSPESAVRAVTEQIDRRLALCEEQARRQHALHEEATRLQQSLVFLKTVASLVDESGPTEERDFIGVALKDGAALERLRKAAASLPQHTELRTTPAADGSFIGLLTTEKGVADTLKEALHKDWIPEVPLPAYLEGRPLAEKIVVLQQRLDEVSAEASRIAQQQRRFATAWRGLYEQVHNWLQAHLAVLDAGTEAFGTERCFVVFGWAPATAVERLQAAIRTRHGDSVVVQQHPLLDSDLAHVPVTLENRGYFKPYELLVSLLPPPRYTSFDPTPFIAVSFPFFFGVILGDIGYGAVLLLVALSLLRFTRAAGVLGNVCRIVVAASIWSILFGLCYGELFGETGAHAVGLSPLLDRRTAIVPTLYFAVSLGAAHVMLGLVLGFLSARKEHNRRETLFRLVSIVALTCMLGGATTFLVATPAWLRQACFLSAAVSVPLLVLTGGLLAPLEFVRHLGNIISYARLMAVGLASVLLAYVANDLAAAVESVWVGFALAIVLHTFNLVLGVFAPTVHALRLHYVEFFSKFFEPGGRRYRPLKQVH